MKEYRIRMDKGNGVWGLAWSATGAPMHIITASKEYAERQCKELEREWKKKRPDEHVSFGIEEREITEWKKI